MKGDAFKYCYCHPNYNYIMMKLYLAVKSVHIFWYVRMENIFVKMENGTLEDELE